MARARQDPELRQLAQDPEIARLLQQRDVIGLLRNARFSNTVTRLLQEPTQEG